MEPGFTLKVSITIHIYYRFSSDFVETDEGEIMDELDDEDREEFEGQKNTYLSCPDIDDSSIRKSKRDYQPQGR